MGGTSSKYKAAAKLIRSIYVLLTGSGLLIAAFCISNVNYVNGELFGLMLQKRSLLVASEFLRNSITTTAYTPKTANDQITPLSDLIKNIDKYYKALDNAEEDLHLIQSNNISNVLNKCALNDLAANQNIMIEWANHAKGVISMVRSGQNRSGLSAINTKYLSLDAIRQVAAITDPEINLIRELASLLEREREVWYCNEHSWFIIKGLKEARLKSRTDESYLNFTEVGLTQTFKSN